MIILGSEAIIIDIDTARKLVAALSLGRSREDYERLQEQGLLDLIDQLRRAVRHDDEEMK